MDDTTSYVYVKRVDSQACVEFRGLHSTPSSISSVFLVPWCHACSWCFDSIAFLCICVVQCGSVKNVSRNWSRFLLFWLNFICVVRIDRYETKSTGNALPKFFYSKSKFINSVIYLKTKPTFVLSSFNFLRSSTGEKLRLISTISPSRDCLVFTSRVVSYFYHCTVVYVYTLLRCAFVFLSQLLFETAQCKQRRPRSAKLSSVVQVVVVVVEYSKHLTGLLTKLRIKPQVRLGKDASIVASFI